MNNYQEILEELEKHTIYKTHRKNSGRGRSITLGFINSLYHRLKKQETYRLSKYTEKKPELYKKILEVGNQIVKHEYTSIQVNHNYKCERHIDSKNVGISTIIGLGNYTGGNLFIEYPDGIKEIDIKNKPFSFNGSKYYHWVGDYEGERYSLVFFNIN